MGTGTTGRLDALAKAWQCFRVKHIDLLLVHEESIGLDGVNGWIGLFEYAFPESPEAIDELVLAALLQHSFSPYFAFGTGRGKENHLAWFSKLSAIRNRIAHPERGTVSEEELGFIEALAQHFENVVTPVL